MQDRRETGALIKVAGVTGVLVLLLIVLEAFVLYHSEEVSMQDLIDNRIEISGR